jgi:hypothetical protein
MGLGRADEPPSEVYIDVIKMMLKSRSEFANNSEPHIAISDLTTTTASLLCKHIPACTITKHGTVVIEEYDKVEGEIHKICCDIIGLTQESKMKYFKEKDTELEALLREFLPDGFRNIENLLRVYLSFDDSFMVYENSNGFFVKKINSNKIDIGLNSASLALYADEMPPIDLYMRNSDAEPTIYEGDSTTRPEPEKNSDKQGGGTPSKKS